MAAKGKVKCPTKADAKAHGTMGRREAMQILEWQGKKPSWDMLTPEQCKQYLMTEDSIGRPAYVMWVLIMEEWRKANKAEKAAWERFEKGIGTIANYETWRAVATALRALCDEFEGINRADVAQVQAEYEKSKAGHTP